MLRATEKNRASSLRPKLTLFAFGCALFDRSNDIDWEQRVTLTLQAAFLHLCAFVARFKLTREASKQLLDIVVTLILNLCSLFFVRLPQSVRDSFPSTLDTVQDAPEWLEFAMCPQSECGHLFPIRALTDGLQFCTRLKSHSVLQPAASWNKKPPALQAPTGRHDLMCGAQLVRPSQSAASKDPLSTRAQRLFAYRRLKTSLEQLVSRPGFIQQCNQWRESWKPTFSEGKSRRDARADITDGDVWESFWYLSPDRRPLRNRRRRSPDDVPYLADREVLTLGLVLNIDWLQPFNQSSHSMGVIVVQVANLPRHLRNRPENLITIGLLPGPDETTMCQLQSALKPFIQELLQLFDGLQFRDSNQESRLVRAFLLAVVADQPATRKAGCFISYSSFRGCYMCDHTFPARNQDVKKGDNFKGIKKGIDFSGVDPKPEMTDELRRSIAEKWLLISNQKERDKFWTEKGSCWTVFMELPYFDTVQGFPIDVMHNIYLGTCKDVMELLQSELNYYDPLEDKVTKVPGLLTAKHLDFLQTWMNKTDPPRDIGRIPRKIANHMRQFKAAEWKTWLCIFAIPALRHLFLKDSTCKLNKDHFRLLHSLQKAACLLGSYLITHKQVDDIHNSLRDVASLISQLFGRNYVKPNVHLHLHLRSMLHNYGPPAGWWCFPFERMNQIFKNAPYSRSSPIQGMMRHAMLLVDIYTCVQTSQARHGDVFDHSKMFQLLAGQYSNDIDSSVRLYHTRSGEKKLQYTWNSGMRHVKGDRALRDHTSAKGNEPFPGQLTGHSESRNLKRWQQGDVEQARHTDGNQVMHCLRCHYGEVYQDHPELNRSILSDDDLRFIASPNGPPAERAEKVAMLWAKCVPTLGWDVILHRQLFFAGQTLGSVHLRGNPRNSFIAAYFKVKDKLTLFYGQVLFYFSHDFPNFEPSDSQFTFAYVAWYHQLQPHELPARSAHLLELTAQFPFLSPKPDKSYSYQDIIPVQRIVFRWTPVRDPECPWIVACPIPSGFQS